MNDLFGGLFSTKNNSKAISNVKYINNGYPIISVMGDIDCQDDWKLTWTSHGGCIILNTNQLYSLELQKNDQMKKLNKIKAIINSEQSRQTVPNETEITNAVEDIFTVFDEFPHASQITELDFIIGFNKSDNTFGQNGFDNALKLYYSDNDEHFMTKANSIPLVPLLNPTVTFSRVVTQLLGKPFTGCSNEPNYTEQTCHVHEFMAEVLEKCGCYPRLVENSNQVFYQFEVMILRMQNSYTKIIQT